MCINKHSNNAYSMEFKAQIINCMKKGESMAKLSRELNIAISTLRNWKKTCCKSTEEPSRAESHICKNTKRFCFTDQPLVEKYLIQWFTNMQNFQHPLPILTQLLQAWAKSFAKELGV